jgi:N-acyl amino acid synthase FeeM
MADSDNSHPETAADHESPAYASGMDFHVAQSVEHVVEAWKLVYHAYYRTGLVPRNPFALHTHRHAASPGTTVITGQLHGLTICSISAYIDSPEAGLPLDSVYRDQLDTLRNRGCRLIEIGLFADRRDHISRQIGVLLELMRYACYYGVINGATDGIIGVHPHHAKFYTRLLGFETIGEEKSYAALSDHPVVLLRLDWTGQLAAAKLPRGLQYFIDHPLSADVFKRRVELTEDRVANSVIGQYLKYIEQQHVNDAA